MTDSMDVLLELGESEDVKHLRDHQHLSTAGIYFHTIKANEHQIVELGLDARRREDVCRYWCPGLAAQHGSSILRGCSAEPDCEDPYRCWVRFSRSDERLDFRRLPCV